MGSIGRIHGGSKVAAGLLSGDHGEAGVEVHEFEEAGADRILPFVQIVECKIGRPSCNWQGGGKRRDTMDSIIVQDMGRVHAVLAERGPGGSVERMEDFGLESGNVKEFVCAAVPVDEPSSPLFKGLDGRHRAEPGETTAAIRRLRSALDRRGRVAR